MNETRRARGRRRRLGLAAAALVLAMTTGCDEDSPLVLEIGTTRLFPAATGTNGFHWQVLKEPERYIQAAKWEFVSAEFSYPGVTVDLARTDNGRDCDLQSSIVVRDPTVSDPNGKSSCRLGVVIDELDTPVPATLDVTFRLTVYRADPGLLIQAGGNPADYDGDGHPNDTDTCPIIRDRSPVTRPRPPQDISDCSFVTSSGLLQSDQDRDGVADLTLLSTGQVAAFDNCVWVSNPGQASGTGDPGDDLGITDGIGIACDRQEAVSQDITIPFPAIDLRQPRNVPSFVVLNFDLSEPNLTCDWGAGTCTLDPSAVSYCITTTFAGCP